MLNATTVREVFDYDAATGELRWRVSTGPRARAGAVAGSIDSDGYRRVQCRGHRHYAHRIIWLFVYGAWPADQTDHRDGDRANNRIENLREASRSVNMQNKIVRGTRRNGRGWQAQIWLDGQSKALGTFTTEPEARLAYLAAKRNLHSGFVESRYAVAS